MKRSRLIKYIIENDLQNECFTGEAVWFSKGRGIMHVGAENHEVYIDSSVFNGELPKRGDLIEFNFNTEILEAACGYNCTILI